MRIAPRDNNAAGKRRLTQDLRRARQSGPLPDPICCQPCPDFRAATGCHRHCGSAPARLSSEGAEYPVEPIVAPLVFELKKLGVFHPCWSCEGHTDQSGALWKLPQVWFYADSVVHTRILDNAIDRLYQARLLSARWHLVLTHSDPDNVDTTFSLEPEPAAGYALSDLQGDLHIIANELGAGFRRACDELAAQAT
jgi:hypothetical protein